MYIACPKCDTKFIVTAQQIGNVGRKVKCSKCANIWIQKTENSIRIEPTLSLTDIEPIAMGNGVNLPALLPIKIPTILYGLPFLLIGMIIFMSVTIFPNFFGIESILNNKNLGIYDLQMTKNDELGKITVTYKVLNSSDKNVRMPLVRIRLLDKHDRVIKTKIDDHSRVDLLPSQNVNISTEFISIPKEAANIDIMLGNKLDFILR